jgi:DNA topoisomerase-1
LNLIIVESPAKARTIKNFLGKDYEVIASKGHIRDLPKNRFGIKIEDDTIIPEYSIPKDNNQIVSQIKTLAKKADTIYIATDEDREGEAIGWHIAHAMKQDPSKLPRIVFHEITKSAIKHALESARNIDMDMVNAQQTRRLLDRIVGYKLSPLLASKIQKGLSGGRVQSSTLKIIVDREREIKAFVPQEYWSIDTIFKTDIEASLYMYKQEKISKLSIPNEQMAQEIFDTLKHEKYKVTDIQTKQRKSSTPPPFMTSTLQQNASSRLGYSPKKTMMLAQSLYEGVNTPYGHVGVITYMRTDSLNLAKEAVQSAREHIQTQYGDKYLPKKPKSYLKKAKGAQEAHEAIRPTMINFTPEEASKYLKSDEARLYKLIYERFMACQMEDAIFEQQSITFESQNSTYKANGRKLIFDGFYRVSGSDDKDKLLPPLSVGQEIDLQNIQRNYINIEEKKIFPTDVAFDVTKMLEEHFEEIVDASFTANMEEILDEIADKGRDWQKILIDFYDPFIDKIEKGKKDIKSLKVAKPLGRECPECRQELLLRKGKFGEFVACSGYPKCRYTEQLDENGNKVERPKDQPSDEKCEKCGSDMVIKNGRNGEFLACSAYPKCKNTKSLEPKEQKISNQPCPDCGGKLVWKTSRRGAFWGCDNYPKCKFISKFEPTDKKCEKCGGALAERTFRNKEVYECTKCKDRTPRQD